MLMKTLKLFLFISAALALTIWLTGAKEPPKKQIVVKHTVTEGQTMWGIACKLASKYGDKRDLSEINFYAKEASGKYKDKDGSRYYDSTIRPGEVLTYVLEVPEVPQKR